MSEQTVAKGKIFELVQTTQPDGRVFEVARRAPGVRVIIADHDKRQVLLTREYRHELQTEDYRLPGGKVFDTLDEYETFRESGEDIVAAASRKAIAESAEEAGIEVREAKLYKKSTLGATVEWDLYVFEAVSWRVHDNGQQLEAGEDIAADTWVSYDEVRQMILRGDMSEERISLILLQWLEQAS